MIDSGHRPLFALPAALIAQGFAIRAETEDDLPFLLRLYASTRAHELAVMPWAPAQRDAFVLQQFGAQRRHYRTHFPDCAFDVILRDGEPVGRLYLDRRPREYHVVDVALLPEARGQGVGTALFQALFAIAWAERVGVGLSVERSNPAQRLYRRLGFRQTGAGAVYLALEWRPPRAVS